MFSLLPSLPVVCYRVPPSPSAVSGLGRPPWPCLVRGPGSENGHHAPRWGPEWQNSRLEKHSPIPTSFTWVTSHTGLGALILRGDNLECVYILCLSTCKHLKFPNFIIYYIRNEISRAVIVCSSFALWSLKGGSTRSLFYSFFFFFGKSKKCATEIISSYVYMSQSDRLPYPSPSSHGIADSFQDYITTVNFAKY